MTTVGQHMSKQKLPTVLNMFCLKPPRGAWRLQDAAMVVVAMTCGVMIGSFSRCPAQQAGQPPIKLCLQMGTRAGAQAGTSVRSIYDSNLSSIARLNANLRNRNFNVTACAPANFGAGWGGHRLCAKTIPAKPCYFYSFGECLWLGP